MKPTTNPLVMVAFVTCVSIFAPAALQATLISVSTTAPLADDADIANLDLTTIIDDFQSSIIWGDRPARGQSFMTGISSGGFELDAITIQSANSQNANGTYFIRVGAVSGTSFTEMRAESVVTTEDVVANDYVTFTLDTPISLQASTLFGFDIGRSGSGWRLLNNAQTEYLDGSAYTSGGGGMGGLTISGNNQDRIFHLNMTAIPEPSSSALVILGGLGLILRRRPCA
ncbi:MAG: hypothetical protein ACI9QL_005074 [Candidatus Omnitrophota bacterium]|jgi:hypothetical protein